MQPVMSKTYSTFAVASGGDSRLWRLARWLLTSLSRCCASEPTETEPLASASDESLIQVLRQREPKRAAADRRHTSLPLIRSSSGHGLASRPEADPTPGSGPPLGPGSGHSSVSQLSTSTVDSPLLSSVASSKMTGLASLALNGTAGTAQMSPEARAAVLASTRKKVDRKRSYTVLPYKKPGKPVNFEDSFLSLDAMGRRLSV